MVSQTGSRVVRSNFCKCKGPNLSGKRAKQKFWGQQVLFGTKLLKFGPKRANLATLARTDIFAVDSHAFFSCTGGNKALVYMHTHFFSPPPAFFLLNHVGKWRHFAFHPISFFETPTCVVISAVI